MGEDYDVVIDAAGSATGLAMATDKARIEGRLVLLGVYFDGISLPGVPMLMKELTVTASMAYGHEHGRSDFADAPRPPRRSPRDRAGTRDPPVPARRRRRGVPRRGRPERRRDQGRPRTRLTPPGPATPDLDAGWPVSGP